MVNARSLLARAFEMSRVASDMSQAQTNGKSDLGTTNAPVLPQYLTNNPLPNGKPWSKLDAQTNYYRTQPNTGKIRSYDFHVARGKIAPDGFEVDGILVNGQYPGPTIEANWGDTIQVTVHNEIDNTEEGLSMHWHGFLQTGTPYNDGAPAITQCPIAPGDSYTYTFKAELYGTSWYHSHFSAQYAAGIEGPIVIYGPQEDFKYDVDVGPVMLTDWYHTPYFQLVEDVMKPNGTGIVFSDNTLINGKNNFDCSTVINKTSTCNSNAGLSEFFFKPGKTHRIRLINSGSEGLQRFSIDGHNLTVIANDFVQVKPYQTTFVTLGIGQRTDILVKADGKQSSYFMRSNITTGPCALSNSNGALAAVYYSKSAKGKPITSTPHVDPTPQTCVNDPLTETIPLAPIKLPVADKTLTMDIATLVNGSGVNLWSLNNVSFRGDYNSPTLLLSKLGNYSFEDEWNVVNTGQAKSVRVILNNTTPVAHPMHLHGFNMYILNSGSGTWDGTIVRPSNPQRRDVMQIPPNGYLVFQFDAAENPGVWPFHCHIAWHVSQGLFVQFLTNPPAVKKLPFPHTVAATCRGWAKYTKTNIPAQIDSGL